VLVDDDGDAVRPRLVLRERGQALVEFALVFPIIVLVVISGVEIGRAVNDYNTLVNAARQGARVAAVNQISAHTECDESRPVEDPLNAHWSIWGCVMAAGAPALNINSGDVSVAYSAPSGTTLDCSVTLHVGCIAAVTVVYQYTPATGLASTLIHSITMSATSQMPIERVFP
jgi:Flp pilus assembly protein TadG